MSHPALQLSIQYASTGTPPPARHHFKRWAKNTIRVPSEITIRIVDAEEARQLNHLYRQKDYATNVLSFPLTETPDLIGDIVICASVVEAEAQAQGKSLMAHYAHMVIHGILHLHGYDHQIEEQAELMESIEVTILHKLGYPNPYRITEDAN